MNALNLLNIFDINYQEDAESEVDDENNDPDYADCLNGEIPLAVLRLVYALQYSTLKSNTSTDRGNVVQFDLPPSQDDYLMQTLSWESGKVEYTRCNNMVEMCVSPNSVILEGLNHTNPAFPPQIWNYLAIRSKKESSSIKF